MDTSPSRMHDASASQQQSTGPAHHRRSITLLTEVPSQWRESLAEMQIIRSGRDTTQDTAQVPRPRMVFSANSTSCVLGMF